MLRKRQHAKCTLRATSDGWASLFARDPIPPPRGHRLALDSVSFISLMGPLGLARYETLVNAE